MKLIVILFYLFLGLSACDQVAKQNNVKAAKLVKATQDEQVDEKFEKFLLQEGALEKVFVQLVVMQGAEKHQQARHLEDYYLRLIRIAATKRPNQRVARAEKNIARFESRLQKLAASGRGQLGLYEIALGLRQSLTNYYKYERRWSDKGVEKILEKRLGRDLLKLVAVNDPKVD